MSILNTPHSIKTDIMGIFDLLNRANNAFFDGLKANAVNTAVHAAKKNKRVPSKVVQHMIDLEKASKELEQMLKDIE